MEGGRVGVRRPGGGGGRPATNRISLTPPPTSRKPNGYFTCFCQFTILTAQDSFVRRHPSNRIRALPFLEATGISFFELALHCRAAGRSGRVFTPSTVSCLTMPGRNLHGGSGIVQTEAAEMQKAADAADISVLFFSDGPNFWSILAKYASVLFKSLFATLLGSSNVST